MTRLELLRRLVLNSICDDYENIDQRVLRDVLRDGALFGLLIDRAEVVDTLAGLVNDGLATVHHLSERPGESLKLKAMPPIEAIETEEPFHTYFLITEAGMKVHLSDDAWFPSPDDAGEPPAGWRPEDVLSE